MHFSWKNIWLYRFALVLMVLAAALLVLALANPALGIESMTGSRAYSGVARLVAWSMFFVLLVVSMAGFGFVLHRLRTGLNKQIDTRNSIGSLRWSISKVLMLVNGDTAELIRPSGSRVLVRVEKNIFFVTATNEHGIVRRLKLTETSVEDIDRPASVLSHDYIDKLKFDINLHASRLRNNLYSNN